MTVRDPLLDYGGDPAELLSRRLENRVLAGQSGMFTTYSGYYKGAHISIVSGGRGSPAFRYSSSEAYKKTFWGSL